MEFLKLLQTIRTPVLDFLMQVITLFGEETIFIIAALAVFWCRDKWEGFYLFCVSLTGTVLNQVLKLTFRVPRPWVRDPSFEIVESARAAAVSYSFPSGHTQFSVSTFGSIFAWDTCKWLRAFCVAICILTPFSRMYLGVHTPADVGVSFILATAMVIFMRPIIKKGMHDAKVMRLLLGGMTLFAFAALAFVTLYPFPADVDAHNLSSSTKQVYTMLGCILGLFVSFEFDHRYLHFETKGSLLVQAIKLLFGLALLLAIKSLLKAPLHAIIGSDYPADCVRYFLMVAFAGCIWPMTFPYIRKLTKR